VKVALDDEEKSTDGMRLITQTTDSILVPHTSVFSERVLKAESLCSINQIEFYNPTESPGWEPGLEGRIIDLGIDACMHAAYAIGLMNNMINNSPKCMAFLIRNATDPKYKEYVKQSVTSLVDTISDKIEVKLNEGKLGHFWIILKGAAIKKIQRILSGVTPEKVCLNLSSKEIKNFVAGMLDAYVNEPLYGGDPVLAFSIRNSVQKRFLQNALILYDSRIVETSCITSHAPKFLESIPLIRKKIPVRNSTWNDLTEVPEAPKLFSRIRGWFEIQTSSKNLIFEEKGFSPIVDGLYTYPSIISD